MKRTAALGAGVGVLGTAGITAIIGRVLSPGAGASVAALGTSTSDKKSPPANKHSSLGTYVGKTSQVPVGEAASFTDPFTKEPAVMVHPSSEEFRAFSAVCPHAGCTVGFDQSQDEFVCPCHGSTFNGSTGALVHGPATHGLTQLSVKVSGGRLYIDD